MASTTTIRTASRAASWTGGIALHVANLAGGGDHVARGHVARGRLSSPFA